MRATVKKYQYAVRNNVSIVLIFWEKGGVLTRLARGQNGSHAREGEANLSAVLAMRLDCEELEDHLLWNVGSGRERIRGMTGGGNHTQADGKSVVPQLLSPTLAPPSMLQSPIAGDGIVTEAV